MIKKFWRFQKFKICMVTLPGHTIGKPGPKITIWFRTTRNRFEGTQWVLNIGSTRSDCPGTQTSMNEDSSNLSKALEAIRCLAESVLSAECAMPLYREIRWVRIPVVSWCIIDIMMYFIILGALVLPWIPMRWCLVENVSHSCRHVIPGEAQVEWPTEPDTWQNWDWPIGQRGQRGQRDLATGVWSCSVRSVWSHVRPNQNDGKAVPHVWFTLPSLHTIFGPKLN